MVRLRRLLVATEEVLCLLMIDHHSPVHGMGDDDETGQAGAGQGK